MSKRIDITGIAFGNVKAIEYSHTKHTHAYWKVKCLLCDRIFTTSCSNLKRGNTTACAGCTVIGLSREQRDDIVHRKANKEGIASIARHYGVSRQKIYSVLKKMASAKENKA
ncbi:MAG: Mor transcription activator family protein [Campylobacterota bacterium]|nr:Mor transcription activator family protein [Campylobacterota bacterium]